MRKGFLWLILATLLWSGNYIAGRILASQMDPLLLNAIRWSISSVILVVLLRIQRQPFPWRYWKELALLGLVGMFLFSALTYLGLKSVPAAQAGMISGTMPVLILLSSVIILRDRPSRLGWMGVALSVGGVFLLVSGQSVGRFRVSVGDAELLGAAVAWSLYTVLGKKIGNAVDSLSLTTGASVFGAVFGIVAAIATHSTTMGRLSGVSITAILYVSTMASVVAYYLWTTGVFHVGAGRSGPLMNLLPVWTVALGVLLLHEQINGMELIGGAITIVGAWLSQRFGWRSTTKSLSEGDASQVSIK